jgi:hypothetical protein
MYLEKLILKLKKAKCLTPQEKRNVNINIKLCEMQIRIRDKNIKR